jgi:DNA-binding response OmpR family regulator
MERILVVEDDAKIASLLAGDLEIEGYKAAVAHDGVAGLEKARTWKPDLIVLDVMLPGLSGLDLCRTLRGEGNDTPVIFLTARSQEADKVVGLGLGADDYVTKPFSGLELLARIKAHLRRRVKNQAPVDALAWKTVKVDFKKMEASRHGKAVALTPKEFQILEYLVRRRGDVVRREKFLEDIWGYEEFPSTRTVDNQILTLRKKLFGQQGGPIVTVHGAGYKWVG